MERGTSSSTTTTISAPRPRRRLVPGAAMGRKYLLDYQAVKALWEDDSFDECEIAAQKLLEKHDLPANLRMRTLILLSSSTDDWDVAQETRQICETLWQLTRKRYRHDTNESAHTTLQSIRESLDELRDLQEEESLDREYEEAISRQHQELGDVDREMGDAEDKIDGDNDKSKQEKMAGNHLKAQETNPVRRMSV
ncbi:hypothetical protein D6C89_04888 [Aureobasidium pullulans]|nr:hypothetical protein D6C89_04888 [Aureobasidium pullulans]